MALSSTPGRQPTKLLVHTNVIAEATLVNLSGATWTYLHGWVTGYYWHPFCPPAMQC